MGVAIKGNVVNANPTPGNSFYQFTHNQNTGADGLIVIQLTMSNARTYTGCTYGGVSMTQLYTINRSGLAQRMAFFYLENPPTGNNTLRINFNGSQWNPISIHSRSFTGSGGIGNNANTGGSATPNTQSTSFSADSFVMATACSINAISTIQIPQGSNRTFASHNTNRQVGTGAISVGTGAVAGSYNVRTTATFGNLTNDRVEILGLSAPVDDTGGDFFLLM